MCILMFGVLVQTSAVCHVVTCSLPSDPPACHHETADPETCGDFAAATASIGLDFVASESGAVSHSELLPLDRTHRVVIESPSPPPLLAILRI